MKSSLFALAALLLTAHAAFAGSSCDSKTDPNAVRTEAPAQDGSRLNRDPAELPMASSQFSNHFSRNLDAEMAGLMDSSMTVTVDRVGRDSVNSLEVSDGR